MPFPFPILSTSSFSFSPYFECDSHPSLPQNASTYRGVAKDALKRHKRLNASEQAGHLTRLTTALSDYIPYLLALDAGLHDKRLPSGQIVRVRPKAKFTIKWRPILSGDPVPGRERSRVRIHSLEHEIGFVLCALGFTYVQAARAALQPLYATTNEFVGPQERTTAISAATKLLLQSASTFKYAASRAERSMADPPCVDVAQTTLGAMASLAHAEATILAVLKDDPYPAAVAQDRNKTDKEWMFKSPEIPKVRAHLYARLCLAASEHASRALSLAQASVVGSSKLDSSVTKYIEDFRQTSRAKACRFLGIDAELGGQTAEGIGWLQAGLQGLGVDIKDSKKGLSLSRFKKDLSEMMEDRRIEKEKAWGADAGKLEETRVIELLDGKWNKINDTVSPQITSPSNQVAQDSHTGTDEHKIGSFSQLSIEQDAFGTGDSQYPRVSTSLTG